MLMFKVGNKMLSKALTSLGKLKQKTWGVSAVVLVLSVLLVINMRSISHHNWMGLSSLMALWGFVHAMVSRCGYLLKGFFSLCVFLLPIGSLASNNIVQPQSLEEKSIKEIDRPKDSATFVSDGGRPSANQASTSILGGFRDSLIFVNKILQLKAFYEQETSDINQFFNEVEWYSIFMDELLYSHSSILDKKKELEQLSVVFDESEKKLENIHSEFGRWMSSLPKCGEVFHEALSIDKFLEEENIAIKNAYEIRRDIIDEYIKVLNFLSKAYGTYENVADSGITFSNLEDNAVYQAHCETIVIFLLLLEEDFALLPRQYTIEMEELSPETNSDPIQIAEERSLEAAPLPRCFEHVIELCMQSVNFDWAFFEIDVNSIYTREVLLNLIKITEKKKKLEELYSAFDAMEEAWEKHLSDLAQEVSSSPHLNDQIRREFEYFDKSILPLMERLFAIKKEYVLEYINLLNFLSIRFGTYKLINDHSMSFASKIESKLFRSYNEKIKKLHKEEKDLRSLIGQYSRNFAEEAPMLMDTELKLDEKSAG